MTKTKATLVENDIIEIDLSSIRELKQQDLFTFVNSNSKLSFADQFDQRVSQRDPRTKSILSTIFADVSDDFIKNEPWYGLLQFVAITNDNKSENRAQAALKRLCFAFVLDAADVLTGPVHTSSDTIQHSRDRIWIHDNSVGMFSFRWCCEILEVDYKHLRKKIREAMDTGQHICTNRKLAHTYRRERGRGIESNDGALAANDDVSYVDALDVAVELTDEQDPTLLDDTDDFFE